MKPYFAKSAVIGLASLVALTGPEAVASGGRLHTDPQSTGFVLSYDGSKMIVLRSSKGRMFADVVDTRSGESRDLLKQSFNRMSWGEDSNTAYASIRRGRIFRLSFLEGETKIEPIKLISDHGIPKAERPRLVSFPSLFNPFLFARGGKRLYSCGLQPAENGAHLLAHCRVVDSNAPSGSGWLHSPGGKIAARIVLASTGELEFQTPTEERGWRRVFRFLTPYTHLQIVGTVQEDDTVWALSNRNRAQLALVKLNVSTGQEEEVYSRLGVDVEGVGITFDKLGEGSPVLVSLVPGYQEVVHFESRLKASYAAISDSLGEPLRIDFKSADLGLNVAVVEVQSPAIYRQWLLLDLQAQTFRKLSSGTLAGYNYPAGSSRPVSFPASDGRKLHGYLTLPQHPAPHPLVVMLHGGPWLRDSWPAPPLVRFLGSQGYAVLRLNYRGSTGYGRNYLEAGGGALFGRLQQDVLDAARWAVVEGHAAADRIALHGGSFGGFLTLSTLVHHPEAFRAGTTINPIIDAVAFWKRDWLIASNRALWRKFMLSRDLPEAALARISPINKVSQLETPVMLLIGARDQRVAPGPGNELFNLLRATEKPVELVEYRGLGHNLWGGRAESREHLAGRILGFLNKHLAVKR